MAGLYRADKVKSLNLQTKTVTATTSAQTVTPDSGYDGLSEVTVNPQSHSGSKSYTSNGQKDLGTNHNTRYVNINVPGVELPSQLEIKCAININSWASASGSGGLGAHDIYASADNVTIPSFLCENFTSFMVSLSNVSSSYAPTIVAYPTSSTTKTITKDTKYTIADYANSSGNLIIGLTNLRTAGGNPQLTVSATITVKLIKS